MISWVMGYVVFDGRVRGEFVLWVKVWRLRGGSWELKGWEGFVSYCSGINRIEELKPNTCSWETFPVIYAFFLDALLVICALGQFR
jgi:hypothetical protein